ncbi:MAG: site-2 protease family protein, partial [Candidatus Diapherotrites archaeon]|nr:site-2 protease family protein [Candidatus Diapherotrites archaeon]
MRYSYTVGKVGDIEIRLHVTFLLLFFGILLWVGLTDPNLFVASFVFLVALFGSVLLHELSHSLVAERVGVRVSSINLLPIGGVAEMSSTDLPARDEFKVAIA